MTLCVDTGVFLAAADTNDDDHAACAQLLDTEDWRRIAELTEQYADNGLGGVDASVIAVAEHLGIVTVATLDQRHFHVVRPRHADAFTIVP